MILEEFTKIWKPTKSDNKIALVSSLGHSKTHLKEKEIYAYISNLFIEKQLILAF